MISNLNGEPITGSFYEKELEENSFGGNIIVKADISNYATKTNLKNILRVDTPSFPLKKNLARLKTEVDKLEIDKIAPFPVDLSKLSDVLKMMLFKKLRTTN